MSEVRSSELKTGLSSSGDPVEEDTAVSAPREVKAFYALNEECGLDDDTLGRFKDSFNSLNGLGLVYLVKGNELAISSLGRCVFMSPPLLVG